MRPVSAAKHIKRWATTTIPLSFNNAITTEEDFNKILQSNILSQADSDELKMAIWTFYPMQRRLLSLFGIVRDNAQPSRYLCERTSAELLQTPHSDARVEKIRADDKLFEQLIPLFHWDFLHWKDDNERTQCVFDAFMNGLRHFLRGKDPLPMWLIIAGQCFIDAHTITKGHSTQAREDLQHAALAVRNSAMKIEHSPDITAHLNEGTTPKLLDDAIVQGVDVWLLNDPTHKFAQEQTQNTQVEIPASFCLLKQSPWLSGTNLLDILLTGHMSGAILANDLYTIITVAHLINAVV